MKIKIGAERRTCTPDLFIQENIKPDILPLNGKTENKQTDQLRSLVTRSMGRTSSTYAVVSAWAKKLGRSYRNRTCNQLVKSQLLCLIELTTHNFILTDSNSLSRNFFGFLCNPSHKPCNVINHCGNKRSN